MKHKLNGDGTAAITPDVKWMLIDENTPIGCRMQLIERAQGVAYTRVHHKGDGFTHWFPLPTFSKDEK